MLSVVGLGPGDESLLTGQAREVLESAEVVVGYTGYIDLVPSGLLDGAEVLSTGMTGEIERCKMAVEKALEGRRVAVVCSGDPGIYAMAGLVFEIVEKREDAASLKVEVVPGVPAFCAASALLGAPLMHDFASVSLSDLLTPWEVIEKRLNAAAEADFVIALYNPKSKKRTNHLGRAIEIIGRHRKGITPVGIVNRAYRQGQKVSVCRLSDIDESLVDMQTVLVIGNSTTRETGKGLLTPRGYASKYSLYD